MELVDPVLDVSGTIRSPPSIGAKRPARVRFYAALLASDVVAVVIGFMVAGLTRFGQWAHPQAVTMMSLLLPLYLVLNVRGYIPSALRDWRNGLSSTAAALFGGTALVQFFQFYLKAEAMLSRILMVVGLILSIVLLTLGRMVISRFARARFDDAPLARLLIVDGVEAECPKGVERLDAARLGIAPSVSDPMSLDRLARHLRDMDAVYVACAPDRRRDWAMVLKGCDIHAELLVPELDWIGVIGHDHFAGVATMLVATGPLRARDQMAKRALDLAIVVPALLLMAPLLLLIAIVIRLESRGPAFFVQRRVGRGNQLFRMYKFRSMRHDRADGDGHASTARDDDRITRVGRFIRATSLDELPQFLNVLRGEMSLVGPRPHALGSLAGDQLFWEVDQRYWHRHASKPGLTGLAQIRGLRGATLQRKDLVDRLRADLEYINGWTIWRDIKIMVGTVRVIFHRNAY